MIRPRTDILAIALERLGFAKLWLKLRGIDTKPVEGPEAMTTICVASHGIIEPDIPDGATHADLPYYDRHGERMVDCDGSPLEYD